MARFWAGAFQMVATVSFLTTNGRMTDMTTIYRTTQSNKPVKTQIVKIGSEYFLDYWHGNGWKNISVFRNLDGALTAFREFENHLKASQAG